jgi:viroplasmin and RNaseH domain-containing protein
MPAARDGASSKRAYYSVAIGRVPGIYASWDDARAQVDAFQGSKHKVTEHHDATMRVDAAR